ncbi:Protein CBG04641 [Caenorhabditis briggsae]|uniref:Protein CBG04641 n=1 Tax=Caenorhabditis briggsae TaxID=6238 RepID=A8WY46_CAEBR|nr:Protein CBG04641 [Caenorhabditis briggsae]CAP25306.1 Protein CBG04641 [Caenorhabditis briggsae]
MDKKPNKSAKEVEEGKSSPAFRETMISRIQRRARSLAHSAPGRAINRLAQDVPGIRLLGRGQSAPAPGERIPEQVVHPLPSTEIARPRHQKKRLEAVRNSVSPSPSRSPPKCVDTPDDLKPRSSNESPRKK